MKRVVLYGILGVVLSLSGLDIMQKPIQTLIIIFVVGAIDLMASRGKLWEEYR